MRNINCQPHWLVIQLTTIKMGIYQVRYTCNLYLKNAFLINSSEEMSLENNWLWILSVNKENLLTFWISLDFFYHIRIFLFFICFARHRHVYSLGIQNCKLDFLKYTHWCHWYLVSDYMYVTLYLILYRKYQLNWKFAPWLLNDPLLFPLPKWFVFHARATDTYDKEFEHQKREFEHKLLKI